MTPDSFEDIAIDLVANDRPRAQFQVRDLGERLARSRYSLGTVSSDGMAGAMKARDALIRELFRVD